MSSNRSTEAARARRVWSLGSYADIAPTFLSMAAHLVSVGNVDTDDAVLDVACGTGNVAITAARRGARVSGVDITPSMLVQARKNAAIAGVEYVEWQEGNAAALPFDDDTFDVTLSCVGHIFANPPDVAGRELCRVTTPGGRIAFTSWTPTSVVPAMGAVLHEYLPPDPDEPEPPFAWGSPEVVENRLGDAVTDLAFETGIVVSPALSPEHFWEQAKTESGLFIVALESVYDDDFPALREEMLETIARFFDEDRSGIPMEYRLARATVA